jgi:hypothetical protein
MWRVVLRCTVKVLNLLGSRPKDLVTPKPTDDDWYANLPWIDRQKCLLAHAGTLFSGFVPGIHKAAIRPIAPFVVSHIEDELNITFLCSDDASFITGETLTLSGGL